MSSGGLKQSDNFLNVILPNDRRVQFPTRKQTLILPPRIDIISDDDEETSSSVQPVDAEVVFKPTVFHSNSDQGDSQSLKKFTPTRSNGFRRAKKLDSFIDISVEEVSQLMLSPSPSTDTLLVEDGEFIYPLVRQSSNGICILLSKDLFVETASDQSIRITHQGRYSAFINGHGTASSIIHSTARLMHNGSSVCCRFGDKLAILGDTGILFTMDRLPKAYWINNTSKGTSAISLENLHLPELSTDCTLIQFYTEAVTGKSGREEEKKIAEEAVYSKKSDGTLVVHINGMKIRYCSEDDLSVVAESNNRQINLVEGSVQVRSNMVELLANSETAAIRYSQKRVHVSCSGLLVSIDGANCSIMDNEGRITVST